ncbi:MAG: tetratricopeptide repeat protein [Elusimicrobia bacterium]|nr:tetratricopeptide repeat protein [Elusimicrobiota bacterium]
MKKKFVLLFLLTYSLTHSLTFISASQSDAYYHYLLGNIAEMKGDLPKAIEEYKKSILYDIDSVYVKKQLVKIYILTGDMKAASEIISEISKVTPDDESTTELAAELSIYNKRPEKAISAYEKILSTEPANKKALYNLGVLYSETGKYEKAILYFEKFLQTEPDSPDVYVNIGILYSKLDRPTEAELYLKKAAEIDGNSVVGLIALAGIYEEKKDYTLAIELYDKLLKILPDDAELTMKIAGLYILQKDYLSVKKYLTAAKEKFPKNHWIDYYLGLLSLEEKDYETALKYFDKSIYLNKKSPEPHIQKGYIFTIQEDTKEAVKSFEKAVGLGAEVSDLYFFLAMNYEVLGKYKKSESYLKKAVTLEPQNSKYRFELGIVYDKLKKQELAEKEFFSVIEIDSNSAVAYNYLGYTYADKNIKLNEAEELIKKALEIDAENPAYIDSLGWVFYRKMQYAEAMTLLKKASKKLDDAVIFDHLGDCYFTLGDKEKAVDSWETSFSIEKNKAVKKKIKKHRRNLKWSKDIIKLRAMRSFKEIQDISGFVSANTIYKNEGYGVNGPFFFKKPKQLRFEILGLFSIPHGLILMRQGTIVYITPEKKIYNLTDDFFWVKDIFSIFDAECFDGLDNVSEGKNFYIFKNDLIEIKVDKKEHTVSEIKFVNGSVIIPADYKLLGKIKFPHKLNFISSGGDIKTTLILKKLNLNKNIKIDLFNVPEAQ